MKRPHPLPTDVYAFVEQTPATVLLEGGKPGAAGNSGTAENPCGVAHFEEPWTQVFAAPLRVCAASNAAEIPALFAEIERAVAAGHSAAGFVSYECGICFEAKAGMRAGSAGLPLAWFGIYERSYAFDHQTGEFVGGEPPELARFRAESQTAADASAPQALYQGTSLLAPQSAQDETGALAPAVPDITAEFALTEAEYAHRIAAIHEWIRAGDVYQLNFTASWRVALREKSPGPVAKHPPEPRNLAALYAHLRARQPVDYGAFVHWGQGRHILSFSPELFFRVDEHGGARRIVTRPMKGTAPRGRTTREDREIAAWLASDAKNRAENLMIVDLERNDLGRVARPGSVRVEKLFAVERYPTLWQITSTVSAELRPDVGFYEIFRALFPCGSVTGAPKVRAMQLLAQLEDGPRGVYTGAIGFFSPRQTVFNVAIRTLEMDGGQGTMGAGSGIVIDSGAAEEYRECLLKAEFLTRSAEIAQGRFQLPNEFFLIETMLWDGGYPLLELHLDRLTDSAEYFGIPCQRAEIAAALLAHAKNIPGSERRKVRLLVDSMGQLRVASEPLTPVSNLPASTCHPEQASNLDCHPEQSREAGRVEGSAVAPPRPDNALPLPGAPGLESPRTGPRPLAPAEPVGRVRISQKRIDPANPMLFHKTTQRPIYSLEYHAAAQAGFDDVLFFNLLGELTEGAISNIFVEKDGRWFTPPVECGLLAGVFRRHLLETRPEIEERVLHEEDLRTADAIYLTNAVRGLRKVEIEW